jgi:hypothetical protein
MPGPAHKGSSSLILPGLQQENWALIFLHPAVIGDQLMITLQPVHTQQPKNHPAKEESQGKHTRAVMKALQKW